MSKKTPDYDNVFKTMKYKHKRLFISVINDVFSKKHPMDTEVEVLPSEGYLTEKETVWDAGHAVIPMPNFSIIYIKKTDNTPKTTKITFTFPDGRTVDYESENVLLDLLTKEYIVEKRLFPYIPFYIARYEKVIAPKKDAGSEASEKRIEQAAEDLAYFRDEMLRLHEAGELSGAELIDLMGFVNTIITHITNGNGNEERLVKVMGGTVIETESERLVRQGIRQGMQEGMIQGMIQGQAKMMIEMGQEDGLEDAIILKRLGLSLEEAEACMEKYGKLFA